MPTKSKRRARRWLLGTGLLVAAGVLAGGVLWARDVWSRGPLPDDLPRVAAFRTDLHLSVNAGGETQSAERTVIECELENLRIGSGGADLRTSGSSTIIELIDDGAMVEEGDVLCRLDSSEYEELVRQQLINVEQARADRYKAELDLRAAEMAVVEYTEGTLAQSRQNFREQIFLYEADIERQTDRIEWARNMVRNGYIAEGQLIRERDNLMRAQINLDRVRREAAHLERFTVPITVRRLEAAVDRAQEELTFQTLRLRRREEQLAKFERQVELCTIRAPHDGMVIYANDRGNEPRVWLGATVRQRMDLFYLPDLAQMEVLTLLHETIVDRVEPGMAADVRVGALPEYRLEGHVVSVAPMPLVARGRSASDEVKNYVARVRIHGIPPGLRPGMSAEVEIHTAHHPDALVVPSRAVAVEDGRGFCYVAQADGLERREIRFAPGNQAVVEVVAGLEEGEEVVLDPGVVVRDLPVVAETALPDGDRSDPDPLDLADAAGPEGLATR